MLVPGTGEQDRDANRERDFGFADLWLCVGEGGQLSDVGAHVCLHGGVAKGGFTCAHAHSRTHSNTHTHITRVAM